jgi:hypothetical protein
MDALRAADARLLLIARALGIAATIALGLVASAGDARADQPEPPADKRDPLSPYERHSVEDGVKRLGATLDPSPQGKTLEAIETITLDVFEPRDPLPGPLIPIANWFHATTRRYVIEREVLVTVGQPWNQALVDETARNLRALPQLSLVLTVPLRGSAEDRVKLLVITKDVWSLRLNNSFTFENGRLQYLLLQPTEENLVGSHQSVSGQFVMDPATFQVGGAYTIPRLDGSRVRASISANAVLNRVSGQPEGSYGSFSYGQPLYSTLAEWAWGASIGWNETIARRFVGGEFSDFVPSKGGCVAAAPGTPKDDPASCRYENDAIGGSYTVTRSWGSLHKHDVTFAFSASRNEYHQFGLPASFTAADRAQFAAAVMPLSDTVIGPYVEYHDYSTRFVDVLDFETLALTENFRRGHELFIHVAPAFTALHSTRDFIDVLVAAAYTVPLGDGLVRGIVQANTEISTSKSPPAAQGRIPDADVEAALRIVTPRFGVGRLVFDARVIDRYADYLNVQSSLGGDTRLRGYPAGQFYGKDFVGASLEYRSRALEILSVDFSGAAFFDTGDAAPEFNRMRLKQSVGVGARVEFPQLERVIMRVDWGFPLTTGPGLPASPFPGDVVVTFGQAFPVPVIPTGN